MNIRNLFEAGEKGNTFAPGMEWVRDGVGTPCIFWDGLFIKVENGQSLMEDPTGGWQPTSIENRELADAIFLMGKQKDGLYQLIGPGINGDPHKTGNLQLHPFGGMGTPWDPRDYPSVHNFFDRNPGIYGIVWTNTDGRTAKAVREDFGFDWGNRNAGKSARAAGTVSKPAILGNPVAKQTA